MSYGYQHGSDQAWGYSSEQQDQTQQPQQQDRDPEQEARRRNQYGDFVSHYPGTYDYQGNSESQIPYAVYNPAPEHPQASNLPSINVYHVPQATPQAIPQAIPQAQNSTVLQEQSFNDEQYYNGSYYQRTPSPNSSVMDYYDQDTQPILPNPEAPQPYSGPQHIQPHSHFDYDLENSSGFIDRRGDDYQINSYLNSNGDMVNPYGSSANLDDEEYEQGSSLSYDDSRDLGAHSYDNDANTITKLGSSSHLLDAFDGNGDDDEEEYGMEKDEESDLGHRKPTRKPTTVRKFRLCMGNFIFDCPISEQLISQYTRAIDDENKLSNEFKFMRYQAVTCQPNDFQRENFTLRQLKYMVPRQTEIMIIITMYNEDDILLGRTLKGVMDNVRYLTKKKNSSTWGPDAWKKVVVCIVSDGRSKIHERSLALMSALGCYQDGFAKDEINDKKVVTHVYEHTTKVNITQVDDDKVELECGDTTVPVQLLFCLKEQNQKKINSHRWALEGFSEVLQPKIVTLLDAGTMPGKDSIYELWREFNNPQVGGACGEIRTDLGKGYSKLLNPLVASQNFEYKMSNILDKTTESNFGFITVLPGAFSAYRFEAIRGEPLEKYFMGDDLNARVFISNMYLAEDRILCFEIVTKKNNNWILRYCKSSYGATDVPERIPEFILQRRRWLNGSFFAALYSFLHFYKIWTSGHSIGRKIMLNLEFIYLFFSTLISWFSLSSFFLVFRILTMSIAITYHEQKVFRVLSVVFLWLYGISLLITFILSLGNKPKGTSTFYLSTFIFFATLMVYMIFCSIYMSVHSIQSIVDEGAVTFKGLIARETFRDLVVSMASTYCLYLLSSIICLQPMHMLTSFVQYLLLSPSYINVLNIYAFCNVHDISWGTKGAVAKPLGKIQSKEDGTVKMEIPISSKEIEANYNKYREVLDTPKPEEKEDESSFEEKKTSYYAKVRSLVIIIWIMSNFIIVAVVLETGGIGQYESIDKITSPDSTVNTVSILSDRSTVYFSIVLWLVAFMAAFRFLGCCFYLIKRIVNKFRFRS